MCGRCAGHLVKSDGDVVCLVCGWRSYPTTRLYRLSPRDRAQRRARVRRVALEANARGACITCGADAVTTKFCQLHREMNNAAALARIQSRHDARLCLDCDLPALTRSHCRRHRDARNAARNAARKRTSSAPSQNAAGQRPPVSPTHPLRMA